MALILNLLTEAIFRNWKRFFQYMRLPDTFSGALLKPLLASVNNEFPKFSDLDFLINPIVI